MKKRLNDSEKELIKRQYAETFITIKELSVLFEVSSGTVFNILKGVESKNRLKGVGAVEFNCPFTKLTKSKVKQILLLRIRDGIYQKDIAEKFNIHQSTVSNICAGKTWKHLFQKIKNKYNQEFLKIN